MDIKNIYELMDRFDHFSGTEMELKMDGVHLVLKRQAGNISAAQPAFPLDSVRTDRPDEGAYESAEPADQESAPETHPIKAPLVGTYYQAPSPDAEPYVRIGQEIHKGDVIGIIEAMKLMNELVADRDGIVTEILVEDGSMVEYDQTLITIR